MITEIKRNRDTLVSVINYISKNVLLQLKMDIRTAEENSIFLQTNKIKC
jgi:hypothetical protein